jgi:hypothetical protein
MARRESIAPLKLAFFVEGDAEKLFIEALVPRVVGPDVLVRVVRVGGKAAFSSTYFEAAQFLEAGYAAVFLIVDAGTAISSEIELQKHRLEDVFRRYRLEDRVRICMTVPMLEAWLLAAYQEDPERSTQPQRDLARLAGEESSHIGALAAKLPLETARRRSRSFDGLVTALEVFAPVKVRRVRRAGHAGRSGSAP